MVVGAVTPLDHHFVVKFPMVFYSQNDHRGQVPIRSHPCTSLTSPDSSVLVPGVPGGEENKGTQQLLHQFRRQFLRHLFLWCDFGLKQLVSCRWTLSWVLVASSVGTDLKKKKQDKLPSIKASVKNESTLCITEWVGMPNLKSNSCAAAS